MADDAQNTKEGFPKDPDAPAFYVNLVRSRTRIFDLALAFYREDVHDTRTHLCDVYMSLAHAKSLRDLIDRQLKLYEQRTGSSIPDVSGTTREAEGDG